MNYQSNFWNRYFKYYDVLLKVIPYQELFSNILASLKLEPNLKLLDLGSGSGNLQAFLTSDIDIVSLDNSEEALERLQTKFPRGKIVKHSILEKLPFDDNSFDRIVSNNVLYTLRKNEWRDVVAEIQRITKPGGIVVISNLNKDFNAVNIYKDHIRKSIVNKGYIITIVDLLQLSYPTFQMIRYNRIINRNNEVGRYSFLEANEQMTLFEEFDLMSCTETLEVYSKQAYLNVFVNRK